MFICNFDRVPLVMMAALAHLVLREPVVSQE